MSKMSLAEELQLIEDCSEHIPVDVFGLAVELGLNPSAEDMNDNVCGLIRRVGVDQFQVAFNRNHPRVRQRFTIAHEIGHYMFHRDLLGEGVGDTVAYRDDGSGLTNSRIGLEEERQANAFAANLLMPNALIKRLREQGIRDPSQMAERLGVSTAAMRIKLGLPPQRTLFD